MKKLKQLLVILTFPGICSANVILTAQAANGTVPIGGTDTVTIVLSDNGGSSNSVGGYQFNLNFNAADLHATSVVEKGYFASNGVVTFLPTINNTTGTITGIYDAAGTPEDPGAGDPLVQVTFSAIGGGISPVTITGELISSFSGSQIADTVSNTTITVGSNSPEPSTMLLAGVALAATVIRRTRGK